VYLLSDKAYIQLKKAFPEVVKALEQVEPGCVIDNGKTGKGKAFKYIGKSDDPLAAERQAIEQKRIEDYVAFCKASAGILPSSWFSSYFENTQLLLDTNREAESGASHIRSSLEQNLTNIDLLPVFNKAITDMQVLRFSYQPFGQEQFELAFHPQFLKEYNGRWFVFGEANREPYQAYNVPLDRIVSEVEPVDDVEYIPAEKGFYQLYFKNIIGVTHEKDAKVEQVVIRTKSEYQHGLLMTKPLHHSQKETLPFGEHDGQWFGEVTLSIEPNRELRGRILMYGESLEVMEPLTLREQIKEVIMKQMNQYADKNNKNMMDKENKLILYKDDEGRVSVNTRFADEDVWLTQEQLATIYQTTQENVSMHISNIYSDKELEKEGTYKKFLLVRQEGKRQVHRNIDHYNLDVIIALGYRVQSPIAVRFRRWATQRLHEYIQKGFTMDDERLKQGGNRYFRELLQRIRDIRSSERNFYQQVTDIYATSTDYDPRAKMTKLFFATVQNKMHYAVHEHTAAELIYERVDNEKPFVGMTNFKGNYVTRDDVKIAKNYLTEIELQRLNLLTSQFLDYAEFQALEQNPRQCVPSGSH